MGVGSSLVSLLPTVPTTSNTLGSQGALGGGAGLGPVDSLFYSFLGTNLQIASRSGDQWQDASAVAPSLVVMNNQPAPIQVGDNVPISQTTVNTTNPDTTLSSGEDVQAGAFWTSYCASIPAAWSTWILSSRRAMRFYRASLPLRQIRIYRHVRWPPGSLYRADRQCCWRLIQQNNAQTGSSVPYSGAFRVYAGCLAPNHDPKLRAISQQ